MRIFGTFPGKDARDGFTACPGNFHSVQAGRALRIRSIIYDYWLLRYTLKSNEHKDIPEPIATKNYSGKFTVRIPPESHRMLAIKAAESGVSLNRLRSSKLH